MMSDEFAKGFGIFVTAGVGWMILAGWYNTPSFEGKQLTGANPETVEGFAQIAILLKDALFWFAIFGALTFWVVIPLIEEARTAMAE
jgi:hypothetical protein